MPRPTTRECMVAAATVSLGIAVVIGAAFPRDEQVGLALRATARWSFFWFWLASTGSALSKLFGARFQPMALHARDFGLAFASAHLVHVALAIFLVYVLAAPFPLPKLIFFGIGVFWVYLLALLSVKRIAALLPPAALRSLRSVGVEYITLVFLFDFYQGLLPGGIQNLVIYVPLLILAVAGPLLRVAAAIKRYALAHTQVRWESRMP